MSYGRGAHVAAFFPRPGIGSAFARLSTVSHPGFTSCADGHRPSLSESEAWLSERQAVARAAVRPPPRPRSPTGAPDPAGRRELARGGVDPASARDDGGPASAGRLSSLAGFRGLVRSKGATAPRPLPTA